MGFAQRSLVAFCFFSISLWSQRVPQRYFPKLIVSETQIKKLDSLELIRSKQPKNKEILKQLAQQYANHGRWIAAMEVYEILLPLAPDKVSLWTQYGGVAGIQSLEVSRAQSIPYVVPMRKAFEQVIKLQPNEYTARWVLMELYEKLPFFLGGSAKKAQAQQSEIEKGSNIEGLLSLAYLAQIRADFETVKQTQLQIVNALSNLSCEQLEGRIKRNQSWYALGKILLNSPDHYELALCSFQRFLNLHTRAEGFPKAFAWFRMAQIFSKQKRFEWAKKYETKARKALPNIEKILAEYDPFLNQ